MANTFDLQEQEQLAQIKHFWNTWGTPITWLLIVVMGGFAAWNGYNFWQQRQAQQATALLEAVQTAAQAGDKQRVEQAWADIRKDYAGTYQAAQAGLLAAKTWVDGNQWGEAKAALTWVAGQASEPGLQALARLRLVTVLVQEKAYDEALAALAASFPAEFSAAVADRKGDVLSLQGKRDLAVAEYQRAYQAFAAQEGYRNLVAAKLNALGVATPTGAAQ